MSQRVLEYTPENYPIAGIFEDLTADITARQMDPLEAVMMFDDNLVLRNLGRRILDYGSTSITTGGHARLPDKKIGEVITANTRTARQIVQVLEAAGAVEAHDIMLSVDLGKTGWDQTQYMSFWLLSNAGPDISEVARRFGLSAFKNTIRDKLHEHEVDLELMGNMTLDREIRRTEYAKFAFAYAEVVKYLDRSNIPLQPVRRLLSLVDPNISIGCYAERVFAQAISIPRFRVTPVRPMAVEETSEAVGLPTLQHDLGIIQAYGAEICVARAGATLVLQRDEEVLAA